MMIEFRPLLVAPPMIKLLLLHHSKKDMSSGCGDMSCRFSCLRIVSQNCLAKTQVTRRWPIVSSS
jgi:hypothetical protein